MTGGGVAARGSMGTGSARGENSIQPDKCLSSRVVRAYFRMAEPRVKVAVMGVPAILAVEGHGFSAFLHDWSE